MKASCWLAGFAGREDSVPDRSSRLGPGPACNSRGFMQLPSLSAIWTSASIACLKQGSVDIWLHAQPLLGDLAR